MSELVALTKEAWREGRWCLPKEKQGPVCSRMEIQKDLEKIIFFSMQLMLH